LQLHDHGQLQQLILCPALEKTETYIIMSSSKTLNGTVSHQETNPNPCFQALEHGGVLQHIWYNHKPTKKWRRQQKKKKDIRPQQMNKKTALKIGALSSLPYSAAPDKDVLELRHLPILQIH
jgi:hypothetical protein